MKWNIKTIIEKSIMKKQILNSKSGAIIYSLLFASIFSFQNISAAEITKPENNHNIFYCTDFGAVGDGITINTKAIQSAIDACNASGGGKVVLSPGTYLSGTIIMKDNVNLYFEQNSTLLASTQHKDFPMQPLPKYRSHKDQMGGFFSLIYAEGAKILL